MRNGGVKRADSFFITPNKCKSLNLIRISDVNNSSKGQSLELFFIDGKPDGMLTAEVFNWTGHVLMAPRTRLSAALKLALVA